MNSVGRACLFPSYIVPLSLSASRDQPSLPTHVATGMLSTFFPSVRCTLFRFQEPFGAKLNYDTQQIILRVARASWQKLILFNKSALTSSLSLPLRSYM